MTNSSSILVATLVLPFALVALHFHKMTASSVDISLHPRPKGHSEKSAGRVLLVLCFLSKFKERAEELDGSSLKPVLWKIAAC